MVFNIHFAPLHLCGENHTAKSPGRNKNSNKFQHMKSQLYLLLLALALTACGDDPVTSSDDDDDMNPGEVSFAVDIEGSEIPYIIIDTEGNQIQNEPKIPASMTIYESKVEVASASIGIEFRGSTSFRLSDKKSFGIETWDEEGNDIDMSFFGFPEEEDWILLGHVNNQVNGLVFDRTLMYHYLGYNLYRDMGRYASRTQFVELEVNGDYLGVYVFMEKLKRGKDRIDIKGLNPDVTEGEELTGGYILKIDKTAGGDLNIDQPLEYFLNNWDDDARYLPENSFRSRYTINGDLIDFDPYGAPYHPQMFLETYFLYEYPKASEINEAQKAYIQDYIDAFETALLADDFSTDVRTYTDYIDLDSFIDHFILNEVCRNVDAFRLSTYLQKDRTGKLAMGPVWDLNIGFDSGDRIPWDDWVINYNNHVFQDGWMMLFWWPRLMEDPIFREALKTRWAALRSEVLSTGSILGLVDETVAYLQDNGAVDRNYDRWDGVFVDYDASIQSLKDFLEFRVEWMDGEIGAL